MIKKDHLVTTERIEAFSDGVIAIIITLMILEIKLPHFDTGTLSGKELKHVIMPVFPKLIAYSLSFFTLGIYWINHHHFFKKVNYSDRGLIWLNLNLLF